MSVLPTTLNPVRAKVLAAAAGAGIGAAAGTFLLWLLGVTIWGASYAAPDADVALAAVPAPVAGLLLAGVAAASSFVAGYMKTETETPVG